MSEVVSGTPSYCFRAGSEEPHEFHASLSLEGFVHGPMTIALLKAACPDGDEVGIEMSEAELRLLRARIDRILTENERSKA